MADEETKEEVQEKPELKDEEIKKALEERVELEDLFPLFALFKDMETAQLRVELAQSQLDRARDLLANAQKQMTEKNAKVNEKYGLNPGTDRIDITSGLITRADV